MAMSSQYRGDANVVRYDPTTIWLHWLTVGAIAVLWLIGQTADWVPRGPFRTGLWSVHVILGFFTGFMLLTRVAWRAHFGRVLPPADTGILYAIAKATHYTLYALLGVVVVLGLVDAFYRGFNVFGVWSLPRVGSGDAATRHAINEWHELAANLTVLVACLHGAAALVHQYVWRDNLLERMKP
ncbi:MAG TPA: cytochrome b/b6 domain-containing protein [Pseudolabrys sp.]|jgi:cytochrome b561|nr:cytochrome b/b6 domain-containing protein [Pseudolabrys sp.]